VSENVLKYSLLQQLIVSIMLLTGMLSVFIITRSGVQVALSLLDNERVTTK